METRPVENLRNIGISAHIDSGKTTLTERILYYAGIIHAMHEVRGKDGIGATMDFMDLERERGITITSAATHCLWKKTSINLIDTPGHVDFTIEVERALRVLDGAILVLCGVSGVQSQTYTVDRQMRRYKIPRIAFINKLDRVGANPDRVLRHLGERLGLKAVAMQLPIGLEDNLRGVVDLVGMKAYTFHGEKGEECREEALPPELEREAASRRAQLLDIVSEFSDELTECILEERPVPEPLVRQAVRNGALNLEIVPVFMGSAFRNIGVQPLLDSISQYLPSPYDVVNEGLDLSAGEAPVRLYPDDNKPLVAYVFKLEERKFGQLSYLRIYQGRLVKGKPIINMLTGKKNFVGRIVRMHSDQMEDISEASAGDIVALFGIDCATGATFTDGKKRINMTSMHVPEPVIDLVVEAKFRENMDNMTKGLNRFIREDPTFQVKQDKDSGQTIISGMGELHLDIYLERLRREYKVEVRTGNPQVAYRETATAQAGFDHTHKKQTGGAGQFARVAGHLQPLHGIDFEFVNKTTGGVLSREFAAACEKGFKAAMESGELIGFPVIGVRCTLTDATTHPVDSSEIAFRVAAREAFRDSLKKAKPVILEPIMKVEVETPQEFQGQVMGNLNQRRGMISGTAEMDHFTQINAKVPLSEMFGYATDLRSQTQGKAEFTMEFSEYLPVPGNLEKELIKKFGRRYF